MKRPTLKPRNVLAAQLWQCGAFHMRTGPDKRRKQQARKPSKQALRNATHV